MYKENMANDIVREYKEYMIVYNTDDIFRCRAESVIDAIVALFNYTGGYTLFTPSELKIIGEQLGISKLLALFNLWRDGGIQLIGIFNPLYDDALYRVQPQDDMG